MDRIERIGLVVKWKEARARALVERIVEWSDARGIELLMDARDPASHPRARLVPADRLADTANLLVVLGGDGTMLATARIVGEREVPVLGVNFGTLGYLTEFTDENVFDELEVVLEGRYTVDPRVMIECEIVRDGQEIARTAALNDVVVNKSAIARIIELDCWIDGRYVTHYRADGLIVSTPTGSTAYNVSAGGPILLPSMGAFVINPICPHTLSNRPLVVPDGVSIEMALRTGREEVMVTVDGQIGFDFFEGDRVRLRKSPSTFNVVTPPERNYFRILRDKLGWGGRIGPAECD